MLIEAIEGLRCPLNTRMFQQFGFQCPYLETSPTYAIKQNLRINVVTVLVGLLLNQENEQRAYYLQGNKNMNTQGIVFTRAYRTSKEVNKNVLNNKIKVLVLGESNDTNKFLRTLLTQSPLINNSHVILYITSQSFVSQVY